MQLSYSVIKNPIEAPSKARVINTSYTNPNLIEEDGKEIEEAGVNIKDYELLGETIVKNARFKAEALIVEATQKASTIEKEAYENGFEQGTNNGYEDGYKQGYENAYKELQQKVDQAMEHALSIVSKAEEDYKNYMDEKKLYIEKIILETAKALASKEIEKNDWAVSLIYDALEDFKGEENIIIRLNEIHFNEIEKKVSEFKMIYNLKGEVFIVKDMRIEPGNIIIEKNTGKLQLGVDVALKEIEKIFSQEFKVEND